MNKKSNLYTQCVLRKYASDTVYHEQVSYIPDEFAVKNKTIKIRLNNRWDVGWVVHSVGSSMEEMDILDVRSYVKRHKKNTGDIN